MLKDNLLKIIILFGIIAIFYFLKTNFSEYNLKKSVSACVLAQKQTSKSFDLEKTRKFCEKEIRKKKQD